MRRVLLAAVVLLGFGSPNVIDKYLKSDAPRCGDAAFLRRAYLDIAGTVPPVDRVDKFLADPDRAKLVDELLAGDDYPRRWAHVWLDTLTGRRGIPDDVHDGRRLLQHLQDVLRRNEPYDAIVRGLITASGVGEENGAVNFMLRYSVDPVNAAGAVGRVFLGARLQCAQCHDHPFADWKQDQFWSLAAYFSRTKRFYTEDPDYYLPGVIDLSRDRGMRMPGRKTGKEDDEPDRAKVEPVYLDGGKAGDAWRTSLAEAVTDPKRSPTFALNAVNRVWAKFFGRGLVEPLDGFMLRGATVPPVLQELSDEFVKHQFDLRWLIRTIATSETYQRTSPVRPLDEDQLFDAIVGLTGHRPEDDTEEMSMEEREEAEAYRDNQPREFFGDHDVSQSRALALLNNYLVHEAVGNGVRVCVTLNGRKLGRAHVEWLYRATLSRPPTDAEAEPFGGERLTRAQLEDLLWALLNSAEFVSNH